jgi:shikimate dehydrogenase
MHNAALRVLGLADWEYALLELPGEALAGALERVRADDCVGANVTIPHKEAVIPFLDDLAESARCVGAVNTIVRRGGQWVGENTDVPGFLQALHEAQSSPLGARAVVLSAGGAARAVAYALGEAGVRSIAILNRTQARAEALAEWVRGQFPHLTVTTTLNGGNIDLIVNALPASVSPDLDGLRIGSGTLAFDLSYHPAETTFMQQAASMGARTAGGLGMLVYQAAASFKLWTGREAPVAVMAQAARQALGRGG